MDNSCACGDDCNCNQSENKKDSSKEKVEKLKKAITDLGFSVEEMKEGEIKISRKK